MGTRDLRTLWSPPVSLNCVVHTSSSSWISYFPHWNSCKGLFNRNTHTHTQTHTHNYKRLERWNFRNCFTTERHTHKGAKQLFFFVKKILWRKSAEKSPMKTYMVKWTFWKVSKKKLNRDISRKEKKKFWNCHILRRKKIGFEITDICGGFGQIPSFLLLKHVYEGCANPNPLTPNDDDRIERHLKLYIYRWNGQALRNTFFA